MGENGDRRLRRIKLTYHTSATENPFTESDLMKSIFSDSVVLGRKPLHRLPSRDDTGSSTSYRSVEQAKGINTLRFYQV